MPYKIEQGHGCPESRPFAIVGPSGKIGCHPTKESALKQMAALYANEPMAEAAGEPRHLAAFTIPPLDDLSPEEIDEMSAAIAETIADVLEANGEAVVHADADSDSG